MNNDLVPLDEPINGQLDVTEPLAAGATMQQVRTPYCTALSVQKPRNLADVRKRLLEEADLAGEDFYYGWGAGKNKIEGPSKELAFAAARCWGNCAIQSLPVQDTGDAWIFTAAFVDLETGFTMERSFRQSKNWQIYGKMDNERKDDVRFQIGQSKAARNVILNCLPFTLVLKAMERAKEGVRKRIEQLINQKGLPGAVDIALRALAKHGISEAQVLKKLGVAEKKAIEIDHLVTLKGDLTAIENGNERSEELYPPLPKQAPSAPAQSPQQPTAAETPPAAPEKDSPVEAPAPTPEQTTEKSSHDPEVYLQRLREARTLEAIQAIRRDVEIAKPWLGAEKASDLIEQIDERLSFMETAEEQGKQQKRRK